MIKFPTFHVATSVTNRILNLRDEMAAGKDPGGLSVPVPNAPPMPTDASESGPALDSALAAPPPAEVPPIEQAPDPGATLEGAPLLSTYLTPGR